MRAAKTTKIEASNKAQETNLAFIHPALVPVLVKIHRITMVKAIIAFITLTQQV